jgi:hypothetical protein
MAVLALRFLPAAPANLSSKFIVDYTSNKYYSWRKHICYIIMKNKIGRPNVPKDKAKEVLLGARFSQGEIRKIESAVADAPKANKSKWLRTAALEAAHYWVDGEGWAIKDLHDKTVEFELFMPPEGPIEGPIRGTGKFDVWQNGEGKLKIRIITFERTSTQYQRDMLRLYVPQEGVKLIKRQPAGATCEFSLFDPLFQKYVRGVAPTKSM